MFTKLQRLFRRIRLAFTPIGRGPEREIIK